MSTGRRHRTRRGLVPAFLRPWPVDVVVGVGVAVVGVARAVVTAAVIRPVVRAVLDSIDLTEVVTGRVDLDEVVRHLDVDAVLARLDMDTVVRQAVDAVDLPRLIRESSGALGSETVVGMRAEFARADDAVDRVVDRVLRRGTARP